MNRWLIVHNLLAYKQHPNMIGNVVKESQVPEPRFRQFGEIQKGDLVVYYATKDAVVVGVFEVASDIEYLSDDVHWGEIMVYRIKPIKLSEQGNYLDFRKLISDPSIHLDTFAKKHKWGSYLQGRTCKLLTNRDYLTIRDALSKKKYLRKTESD